MPELFEHLQAELSAASRHKREVVGHTLSSALDEQTCCSTSEQPKAQLAGARTAQASPRRYSSSLEASTRACGAPGEPLRRKVDLSTSDMQMIAQENEIDNGHKTISDIVARPMGTMGRLEGSFPLQSSLLLQVIHHMLGCTCQPWLQLHSRLS